MSFADFGNFAKSVKSTGGIMKIKSAVNDYIASREATVPPQALNSKTHGAYSYLSRTAENKPLSADLSEVERQVEAEVDASGSVAQVRQNALRLQVASELLWRHMRANKEQFAKYLPKWGWLINSSIRAWERYEKLNRSASAEDVATNRVLEAYDDSSS